MASAVSIGGLVLWLLAGTLFGLRVWRWRDQRRAEQAWTALAGKSRSTAALFDASLVAALPEPARRYFMFTIEPGTPLHLVTRIRMSGDLGLGNRDDPKYQPMRADQILAPPDGLVWKLGAGRGVMRISGSDGLVGEMSWTRFWLTGVLPIVRVGGTRDHLRSAFGRVVAEAVFWAPAALLPGKYVRWEAVDADTARATVEHGGMTQAVDVTVAADGRPTRVVIARWSDANADRTYRLQPFGGDLSEFRNFDGYRLATHVEGGNFIGTDEYFPFYKADVESIGFISDADARG